MEYAQEALLAIGVIILSVIVWEIRSLRRKIDNGLSQAVVRIDTRVKVLWEEFMKEEEA